MSELENVSEQVCTERMKRLEDRVDKIESITNEIHKLGISVERLATTVENMLIRQTDQEKRLNKIEDKDGDMWRSVVRYIITAAIGIVIGFVFKQVGIF